ncbi:hypothetical protein CDAR_408161, partial [Caerostris darwini]
VCQCRSLNITFYVYAVAAPLAYGAIAAPAIGYRGAHGLGYGAGVLGAGHGVGNLEAALGKLSGKKLLKD